MFRPAMSEPVMQLWGDDRPEGWTEEVWAAVRESALAKHKERMSIQEVKDYPIRLREAAYECARWEFRTHWCLALCEENRKADPAAWAQPFREMVISCARQLEHYEAHGPPHKDLRHGELPSQPAPGTLGARAL